MKNMDRNQVSAWEETITLPTYPPPPADPNPMFLEKRINQAASGRVYPNPFTDHLTIDKKVDKPYKALFVENEYIQLMMLPEIGGRIHVGMDKTNNYDFFYRQHVVKPTLIGLFGSWILGWGGVELAHAPPALDLHAGRLLHRRAPRREQDGMAQRARADGAHEGHGWAVPVPG